MDTREGNRAAGFGALAVWALCATVTAGAAHAGVAGYDAPQLTARASLVMDARTGATLWEDSADVSLPPASTTKILTSILALESGRLDEQLEVSGYAQAQAPSKLGLRAGQRMRLMDLVYALMLKSANDAAVVVAEGVGGSVPAFAARMNRRARQLGATGSTFVNPNGLPDRDHLSTAHDLAVILRHALTLPYFRRIAATPATTIAVEGADGTSTRMVPVTTHNRLLEGYFVPVIGKTGYTRAAGRCFAGAAELDGREVIVVVLGSSNLWEDTRRLIDYGFGVANPGARPRVQLAAATGPRDLELEEGDDPRPARIEAATRGAPAEMWRDETPPIRMLARPVVVAERTVVAEERPVAVAERAVGAEESPVAVAERRVVVAERPTEVARTAVSASAWRPDDESPAVEQVKRSARALRAAEPAPSARARRAVAIERVTRSAKVARIKRVERMGRPVTVASGAKSGARYGKSVAVARSGKPVKVVQAGKAMPAGRGGRSASVAQASRSAGGNRGARSTVRVVSGKQVRVVRIGYAGAGARPERAGSVQRSAPVETAARSGKQAAALRRGMSGKGTGSAKSAQPGKPAPPAGSTRSGARSITDSPAKRKPSGVVRAASASERKAIAKPSGRGRRAG